jgi:triosephosphate isomerase
MSLKIKPGQKIFAANWKLHKNPQESRVFFEQFSKLLTEPLARGYSEQILFFPPATSCEATSQALQGSAIHWGSQNCGSEVRGAFTGEISAQVIKDLGGAAILLGHSERRNLFFETDAMIKDKLKLVQALELTAVLCIGEKLPEREAGVTQNVLMRQLDVIGSNKNLVIAYEPVWAIGTGKVAESDQVEEAHLSIRKRVGAGIPILYGGSVKFDNAKKLLSIANVDGFLVGGASLEADTFAKMCFSVSMSGIHQ